MKFRRTVLPLAIAASISVLLPTRTYAGTPEQDAKNYTQTPSLEEYRPRSTLVTREHKIERARFPFIDRKSTRLNSSHGYISYAVFCLKKKKAVTRSPKALLYDRPYV